MTGLDVGEAVLAALDLWGRVPHERPTRPGERMMTNTSTRASPGSRFAPIDEITTYDTRQPDEC